MEPLVTHKGKAAVLNRINVDTDQIIPKQFLKRIERTGYGRFAFFDWRYLADGSPNPDFELNQPIYEGASILIAGRTLAADHLGNMLLGRLMIMALKLSSHHHSQIYFIKTALKMGCFRFALIMMCGKPSLRHMRTKGMR